MTPASRQDWFGELQKTGSRALTEAELRTAAGRFSHAYRIRNIGVLGGFFFAIVIPGVILRYGTSVGLSKDASDGYFILSFFVGLFGGMIVAGLKQPRCNFWKAVLAARTVEVFTGKTAADRYSIPFNRIAEGIHEGETGQYEVEILPGSSLMYRINGHPVTTPIPAIVSSVVALRSKPYSPRVPDVWRGPDLSSSQELRHRHLSSEEKEELGEQISRLSRFRWEFRGFYLLFIVLGIAHKIASPHVASVLMPLVFIGLLTLDFKRYGSPGGLRAHLVDDLSDGKLFIVSETDLGKEQVELEILPHSNAIWSANGVPGGWRLFR